VAAQVIEAIAFVELPRKEWPELMTSLLSNMTSRNSSVGLKKSTLETIGFICEEMDFAVLAEHSNGILTAVIQGALKEEP
jgi:importin subunit beta-1